VLGASTKCDEPFSLCFQRAVAVTGVTS
jgi:hypothetical protein